MKPPLRAPLISFLFLLVFCSNLTEILADDDAGPTPKDEHLPVQWRLLQPSEPCSCSDGMFEIEAFYTGEDPAGLNVATTALGDKADAPEVYHLNLAEDDLNQVVTRRGCFDRNSLYRFVVYQADTTISKPTGSYVALFVNGRMIARVDEPSNVFEEFYFVGDSEGCNPGFGRFTFDILFDLWPEENSWELTQFPSGDPVLSYAETLKAGTFIYSYSPEFKKSLLFVDQCIPDGDYLFEFKDLGSDGIVPPGMYEAAVDGAVLFRGPNHSLISSEQFSFSIINGGSLSRSPTPAPVLYSPNSIGTFSPQSIPGQDKTENPVSLGVPTSGPLPPPQPFPSICFSGSTTVNVKDKGPTEMRNLLIGSIIEVKKGIFEPVYSFGHYDPHASADLLEIRTNRKDYFSSLQLSRQHLLFADKEDMGPIAVPASSVQVGDHLVSSVDNNPAVIVESVKVVHTSDGLFAPFTPSGKLLVNGGLLVSSFIAFDELSPSLRIVGIEFSYHWLAHSFEFPHRLACYHFMRCPLETYTTDGLSTWVAVPLKLSVWLLLGIQLTVVKEVLLVIFLCSCLILSLGEYTLYHAWFVIAGLFLVSRKVKRRYK